jgi:hypothetical protein
MSEVDHDWDKLIPKHKEKYTFFDRVVLVFIFVILSMCTAMMFLSLFKPDYFGCV